jgi:hypothetical protein
VATYGSLLFSVARDGAYVRVAMGSLVDGAEHPADGAHLHRLQGAWFEIADDLPQFEELTF